MVGRHRLGQVDDARGDDQLPQRELLGSHRHDRGSDRVPAHQQALDRQPARSRPRHQDLRARAARRDARGARRHPHRRDPRPRDAWRRRSTSSGTGHLVLATLHANNCAETLDRIINMFPREQHKQIFLDLSQYLRAIMAQRLVMGKDGKRVAAVEVMLNTPHIARARQEGRRGRRSRKRSSTSGERGIQSFDVALLRSLQAGPHRARRGARQRRLARQPGSQDQLRLAPRPGTWALARRDELQRASFRL